MSQLTIDEREQIMKWLSQWKSKRKIATELWRHHSTICNEIKRNRWRWEYSANKAQHKKYVRKLFAKKNLKKIRCNDELEQYIRKKIKKKWSPELISWRWNKKKLWITISTQTIYKYVYSKFAYDLLEYLYSNKNWRRKRWSHKNSNNHIKDRIFIDDRPKEIWLLTEFGHREADLVVWPRWTKEVLLTIIEKKSRRKIAKKLPNKKAINVELVLKYRIKNLWIKSITFDNWLEFANHYRLGVLTYFSNPYHSWEKAQIERCNREYRRYFPKWTIRKKISQKEIDKVTNNLNNKPMKVLDFDTPNEVLSKYFTLFSSVSVLTL